MVSCIGLVKALGDDLGIKDLVVKQVKSKSKDDEEDVFRVRWVPQYDVSIQFFPFQNIKLHVPMQIKTNNRMMKIRGQSHPIPLQLQARSRRTIEGR